MVPAVGHPDLSPDDRRGLVIFPAPAHSAANQAARGEWWLVAAALIVAAAMIAIAFAIR